MAKLRFYVDPALAAEVSFADTEGKPIVLSFGADGFLSLDSEDAGFPILDALADSPGHPIEHGEAQKAKKPKAEEA